MVVVGSSKLKSQQIALSLSLSPPPDLICFGRGELCAAAAGTTLSGRSGWATIYNDHIGKASTTTTRLCVMWDLRCLRRHRKSRQLFSFPLLYIFFLVHLHIRYYRTGENILFFLHRDEIKVEFYYIKCLLMESKAMLTCPSTSRRCGNRRATRFATLEPRGIRRGGRKPCQEQHDVIYFHLVLLLLLPRRVFFLSPLKSNPRACLILLYNYSTRV